MELWQRYLGSPAPFPLIPVVSEIPRRDMKTLMPQIQLCSGLRKWFLFLSGPAIINLTASPNHPCGSFLASKDGLKVIPSENEVLLQFLSLPVCF